MKRPNTVLEQTKDSHLSNKQLEQKKNSHLSNNIDKSFNTYSSINGGSVGKKQIKLRKNKF